MRVFAAAAALAAVLLAPARATAQDPAVPPALQGVLYAKVLTFDRALPLRAHDGLTVGVLYQQGWRTSRAARESFMTGFREGAAALGNVSVRLVELDYADPASLAAQLQAAAVDVLYIAPLRGVDLVPVLELARMAGVLTMAGEAEYMRTGVSVGARLRGDRPVVLINPTAAAAEGSAFGSQLLRLAELVR